ncbi:MAG: tRNA (N(6)-L-threonylcarbamoyladenosine(37)-C(2))-methylthiotransferase MtaB [Desulfosoma sp.]
MRFALETLGCKVNQYESSAFLESFLENGWKLVSFSEKADLYVVHGCSVTNKASYQTRQLLRRAFRTNPKAHIAVVGCDAQIHWQRYAQEHLATHIVGSDEKFTLRSFLEMPGTLQQPFIAVSDSRSYGPMPPLAVKTMIADRSRAFLKIQDGCDAYCTYCIVPFSRGRSRSLEPGEVLRQLERLTRAGYREVVLTGIHLGQWGLDLPWSCASNEPRGLAGLLQCIDEAQRPERIRLSSLESKEINEALLKALKAFSWICPHFHIPLQSGDSEILAAMGRPYTPEQYADTVCTLSRLFPHAAFGADVIVGFPGETEAHFLRTVRLIESLPITYLHVFPYSPRPGTQAASMKGRVVGPALKHRARLLRNLGRAKKRMFQERFVGSILEVLVENSPKPGLWQGTSENYLTVQFQAEKAVPIGSLVRVRISQATETSLCGKAATELL